MAKEPKPMPEVAAKVRPQRITAIRSSALIIPNGVEIAPGETVDLPAEFAENAGVLAWVADGLAEIGE